ncbi:MAG: hypothetical protein ACTSWP_04310 [Candidatus Freyarchaeota archaeon]|nr:MraZ N-terminal domain-containing protein [Candidatus Freyrarchaeum guaymaensis]HDO80699.1 hypothetical protein [Candidatus Bathyarchaeota archaeon]
MLVTPIDGKGRISLPKKFREKCGRKVIIKEANGYLEVHPLPNYRESKGKYPLKKSIEEVEEDEEKLLLERG